MHRVVIVVPAYNEERRIGRMLYNYSEYFNNLAKQKEIDYKIIVVINNTTDNTERIVRKYARVDKRISYLNLVRGGKGYAVIEGFKLALEKSCDLIGFVDADMATSPKAFHELIAGIGKHDGVIASRYCQGAVILPPPTFQRLVAKKVFNLLVRVVLFLPYKDTQCGAKIFRKEVIDAAINDVKMSQWAFDVDLLYAIRTKNFVIKEVPTIWSDREYSKINFWKAGPKMALGVLRIRIMNSPFKRFISIYDNILGSLNKRLQTLSEVPNKTEK